MFLSALKKQQEERSKLKSYEYTSSEVWRALNILQRKEVSRAHITFIKKNIPPEGREYCRTRQSFSYEQAVLILVTKTLKTNGVPLKAFAYWLPAIKDYISGERLCNYDFILCDGKELLIYDARTSSPFFQNLKSNPPQFFWSFNIGHSVKEVDSILEQVKHG